MMRKLFICIFMMLALGVNNSSAQSVTLSSDNVFKSIRSHTAAKRDTLVTQFKWEDSKGKQYPIIVNKGTGSCYIWKISGKTLKAYRMYMSKDISMEICKRLGIEYKVTKRK